MYKQIMSKEEIQLLKLISADFSSPRVYSKVSALPMPFKLKKKNIVYNNNDNKRKESERDAS